MFLLAGKTTSDAKCHERKTNVHAAGCSQRNVLLDSFILWDCHCWYVRWVSKLCHIVYIKRLARLASDTLLIKDVYTHRCQTRRCGQWVNYTLKWLCLLERKKENRKYSSSMYHYTSLQTGCYHWCQAFCVQVYYVHPQGLSFGRDEYKLEWIFFRLLLHVQDTNENTLFNHSKLQYLFQKISVGFFSLKPLPIPPEILVLVHTFFKNLGF